MTKQQNVTGTYIGMKKAINDETGKVSYNFMFLTEDGNGIMQVYIGSEKYWNFLATTEDYFGIGDAQSLNALLESQAQTGTKIYTFDGGFSLTESMFISTKTKLAVGANGRPNTLGGQDVTITKVEADDNTIAIHLADGAIARRNFTTKITLPTTGEEKYLSDIAKKTRFFSNELGVALPPQGVGAFDPQSLVGGTVTYKCNKNKFKEGEYWIEFEGYQPAPSFIQTPPSQRAGFPSDAEIDAMFGSID